MAAQVIDFQDEDSAEETTVYTFAQLSDSAKDKARDWMREQEGQNWEADYESYVTAANLLGIDLTERRSRRNGKNEMIAYGATTIQYSGFWSQGDGASFTGTYKFVPGCAQAVREEFPTNTKLHAIADALQVFQCRMILAHDMREWEGTITQFGNYCHSGTMDATVHDRDGEEMDIKLSNAFRDIMRRFADWIYHGLEDDYNWVTSDEAINESLEDGDYEFDEDGEPA